VDYDDKVKTFPPDQAEGAALVYELALRMHELGSALDRDVAQTLDELDLTEPLAAALWQLDPKRGPLSRRSLAERLRCDPSNVTFLADRLEERGLIERVTYPADRRVKAMSLTAAGVEIRTRLVSATVDGPTFARLTRTQQQDLVQLLGTALGETVSKPEFAAAPRTELG
jgi:MarR family transcriptional regulator, organic hydroperoxide resistance regulator